MLNPKGSENNLKDKASPSLVEEETRLAHSRFTTQISTLTWSVCMIVSNPRILFANDTILLMAGANLPENSSGDNSR